MRVYVLESWNGIQFFTMEYIPGRSLREWMNLEKGQSLPFPFAETLSVILPLLDALSYAHQLTIQCDVKP